MEATKSGLREVGGVGLDAVHVRPQLVGGRVFGDLRGAGRVQQPPVRPVSLVVFCLTGNPYNHLPGRRDLA